MFGYIQADRTRLDEEQAARYRAVYCGLCRTLRREYGAISRLALTYDMTFLAMLLASLYEPDEQSGQESCAPRSSMGCICWSRIRWMWRETCVIIEGSASEGERATANLLRDRW